MNKTLLISLVVILVVAISGGVTFALTRKPKIQTANINATSQQEVEPNVAATTETSTGESCSPPNTPTCGPDGKVVETGNTTKPGGSTTNSVKALSDVGLKNIELVASYPEGIDIDPKTGYVYTGNNSTVISGCNGDTTNADQGNTKLADPNDKGANTLSIIDPAAGKELSNTATESGTIWTQVDNDRNVVYVAGSGTGKIAIHELGTGKKKSTITVNGKPHAFGLDTSTGVMIVSNTNDTSQTYISAIDVKTNKVLGAHKAPSYPHGIAVDQEDDLGYVVGVKEGKISVIDMKTGEVKETFDTGANNSNMMAYSPKLKRIFISDTQTNSSIMAIDAKTHKKLGTIAFSQQSLPAWGMDVDDTNGLLYAALPNGNMVGVADTTTLKPLGTITVDECPFAVKLDLARGLGFTTNQVANTLSVFDLKKVLTQIK